MFALMSNYNPETADEFPYTQEQLDAADVDRDGSVDASDATLMLKYYGLQGAGDARTIEEFVNDQLNRG